MADAARFPADHPWYLSRGLAVAQLLRTHLDVSAGQGPAKVVEIGAGYGHPLFALRRALGFALDVTAVEPDPTCHGTLATVADRIIAQYVSAPTAVSLPGGPFRVAIMLHVLEHLPDPSAYLMQLRECLEPGGLLALEVPNCTAARMSLYPHYVPHLYFFTQTGLGALLERCGFDVASIATYGPEYDERGASDTSFTRHPVEIDAFLARGALPPLPFPVFAESGPNRTFLRAIARVAAEGTRHRSVTTP